MMQHMHEGHRARLKRRFLSEDLDHFEQHEVLELILFYVIPQQDTNVLAHRLIDHFGSLSRVFEASIEELMSINGIKESAATYIKMFPSVFRVYEEDRNQRDNCFDTLAKIAEFAKAKFIGETNEKVYVALFNNRMQMEDCYLISEGTTNQSPVFYSKIFKKALAKNASSILMMHNHPNGNTEPSRADLEVSHDMVIMCEKFGIYYIDHLIVAGTEYTSLHKKYSQYVPLSSMIMAPAFTSMFPHFYDDETTE